MNTFVTKITKGISDFRKFKKANEDHERIFKWVVYTYDRQSPLVKEVTELMKRKGEAAVLAGYKTDEDGRFEEEVEDLLLGKSPEVNNLIVAYISRFADPHYIMLVASWNLLLDGTRKLLSGKQEKDTYQTIKNITKDIDDMTRTVFSSSDADEALELRKALYSRVESDRLKLNQENIIKYIDEHGELPKGFSPYGEGYKVDKLKFIGDGEAVNS
jgi:hypothetical protein